MRLAVLSLIILLIGISISSSFGRQLSTPLPRKMSNTNSAQPLLYQISARPWLFELSQKYGRNISRLADVPDSELEAVADLGFDYVYLLGVWSLGPYGLQHDRTDPNLLQQYKKVLPDFTMNDVIGSPFALTNFTLNPQLGPEGDLVAFRKRLAKLGLKLMLDFVPNHMAVDCPWTTTNIDYFIRAPKGTQPPYDRNLYLPNGIAYGRDPYSGAWTDTAQLNYWNMETRNAMIQNLMKAASLADGLRCDMAMLLLNDVVAQVWGTQLASWGYARPSSEFWYDAVTTVRKLHPKMLLMAEVYWGLEPQLQALGFDITYDKTLYDRLSDGNLDNIRGWLRYGAGGQLWRGAHFVENHDEDRAVYHFGSIARANAAALVSMTVPGLRFYFHGQLDGLRNRLDVHLRRAYGEAAHPDVRALYTSLIKITSDDVFHSGQWVMDDVTSDPNAWRLMAWRWHTATEKRLCVVNYSDQTGAGRVVVSDAQSSGGNDTIPITELLTGAVYHRSASEMRTQGLMVVVNAWSAQIFKY